MIKVIGNDPKVAKQATCRNCGAILEYMPCAVKEVTTRDISGCADTDYYIQCHQCNNRVLVGK